MMKDLRSITYGFFYCRRSRRNDHKLLHVYIIGGMLSAVKDIHHRNRKDPGPYSPDVTVKGKT